MLKHLTILCLMLSTLTAKAQTADAKILLDGTNCATTACFEPMVMKMGFETAKKVKDNSGGKEMLTLIVVVDDTAKKIHTQNVCMIEINPVRGTNKTSYMTSEAEKFKKAMFAFVDMGFKRDTTLEMNDTKITNYSTMDYPDIQLTTMEAKNPIEGVMTTIYTIFVVRRKE